MTGTLAHMIARLGLPPESRDEVLGDLTEEGLGPGLRGHVRALTGVALYVQLEPYRDPSVRLWCVGALGGALLLWWAVLSAGFGVSPEDLSLWDPLSRGLLRFWSASHVTAALAAGLLLGYLPGPESVGPARAHGVFLLALVAAGHAAVGWGALAGGAALMGAACLGSHARVEATLRPAR